MRNIYLSDARYLLSYNAMRRAGLVALVAAAVVMPSSAALSFDSSYAQIESGLAVRAVKSSSPAVFENNLIQQNSSAEDACSPLLKSIRYTTTAPSPEKRQRAAGAAAALGMLLGARFALPPADASESHVSPDSMEARSRSALAVADYRRCQKEQALATRLSDRR